MANNFGKGIKVTSGFDLGAKGPLDNRTVVDTIAERNAHITEGRGYIGLKVYVVNEDKEYVYSSGGWIESGGMTDEQSRQLLDAYTHSTIEHASKEMVDDLFEAVQSLPTKDYIDDTLKIKADSDHIHNDIYYNKEEVDQRIVDIVTDGKVDLSNYATLTDLAKKAEYDHIHVISDITNLEDMLNSKANKDEVVSNSELATKADVDHTHSIADTANLQNILDLKANIASVYTRTDLNVKFAEINIALADKSPSDHVHDDFYYKKEEVDQIISNALTDGELNLEGYVSKTEFTKELALYSKEGHDHTITDITGIEEIIPDTYSKSEIDITIATVKTEATSHADNLVADLLDGVSTDYNTLNKLATSLASMSGGSTLSMKELEDLLDRKSADDHIHDDRYYDKATVESMIQTGIEGAELEKYVTKDLLTQELGKKADHDHEQTMDTIIGLDEEITDRINTAVSGIDKKIEDGLASKADYSHTHNDIYYTKDEVNERVQAGVGSIDLTVLVTKSELTQSLALKADEGHAHNITDITDLESTLNAKANAADSVTKSELAEALKDKAGVVHDHKDIHADKIHDHNDIYYSKTQIDALLDESSGATSESTLQAAYKYTEERISDVIGQENDKKITTIKGAVDAIIEQENALDAFKTSTLTALNGKSDSDHNHDDKYSLKGHTHEVGDLNLDGSYYNKTQIDDFLKSKASSDHNHDDVYAQKIHEHEIEDLHLEEYYYNKTQISGFLDKKADADHNHDDVYAPKIHEHEVEDLHLEESYYNKTQVDAFLKDKENIGHNHDDVYSKLDHIHEVGDLNLSGTYYDKTQIDNFLNDKADADHNHSDVYAPKTHDHTTSEVTDLFDFVYNKSQVDEALGKKASDDHGHAISEITNLETTLSNKADITYVDGEIDSIATGIKTEYQQYVEETIAGLVDGAPDAMNTLNELASAIKTNKEIYDAYVETVSNALANKSESDHTHDDVYDKKYAPISHTHLTSNITDFDSVVDDRITKATAETLNDANEYTEQRIADIIGLEGGGETSISGLSNTLTQHINEFNQHKLDMESGLADKSPKDHNHDDFYSKLGHTHEVKDLNLSDAYYNKTEIDEALADKSPKDHSHDDRYSELGHTHDIGELDISADYYNKSEIDSFLGEKSDTDHSHTEHYTKEETDNLLKKKANASHNHNTLYYTEAEVDSMFNGLALDQYATYGWVEDWTKLMYAPIKHTHEDMSANGLISEEDLDNMLIDIYGFVYKS